MKKKPDIHHWFGSDFDSTILFYNIFISSNFIWNTFKSHHSIFKYKKFCFDSITPLQNEKK